MYVCMLISLSLSLSHYLVYTNHYLSFNLILSYSQSYTTSAINSYLFTLPLFSTQSSIHISPWYSYSLPQLSSPTTLLSPPLLSYHHFFIHPLSPSPMKPSFFVRCVARNKLGAIRSNSARIFVGC